MLHHLLRTCLPSSVHPAASGTDTVNIHTHTYPSLTPSHPHNHPVHPLSLCHSLDPIPTSISLPIPSLPPLSLTHGFSSNVADGYLLLSDRLLQLPHIHSSLCTHTHTHVIQSNTLVHTYTVSLVFQSLNLHRNPPRLLLQLLLRRTQP